MLYGSDGKVFLAAINLHESLHDGSIAANICPTLKTGSDHTRSVSTKAFLEVDRQKAYWLVPSRGGGQQKMGLLSIHRSEDRKVCHCDL